MSIPHRYTRTRRRSPTQCASLGWTGQRCSNPLLNLRGVDGGMEIKSRVFRRNQRSGCKNTASAVIHAERAISFAFWKICHFAVIFPSFKILQQNEIFSCQENPTAKFDIFNVKFSN